MVRFNDCRKHESFSLERILSLIADQSLTSDNPLSVHIALSSLLYLSPSLLSLIIPCCLGSARLDFRDFDKQALYICNTDLQ